MYRYLALVWTPGRSEAVRTVHAFRAALVSGSPEWSTAYEGTGALVVHTRLRRRSAEAYRLGEHGGVVLGKLFDRRQEGHGASDRVIFDEARAKKVVDSGGRYLIDHYWGAYFAIVHDESTDQHHVFREPIGNLACYHARHTGVDLFFSHIEDCVRFLPISLSVNRSYLTRWLIFSGQTTQDTGIDEVENLPAGERLTFSHGNIARTLLWNPIDIARTPRFEQPDEAAGELRSTVQNAINAWASCYQRITHRLSGGLDSSIVAGCLAQAPTSPHVTYLNLTAGVGCNQERFHLPGIDERTAEKFRAIVGHGDERYFARLVADRWKTPLIERERTLSMDLTRLWETPLRVSPAMYFAVMEMDDAEAELAQFHGTQAFFSGQAGDSIFLATTQPLPAIDYAHLHGIGPGLWGHLLASSRLSKESLWSVLGKAMRHGVLRRPCSPPVRILELPTLLREELRETFTNDDFESQLSRLVSRSALPQGKQNHVAGLAGPAYYDLVFRGGQHADHIDPLNSQPIWELMLRMPTYTLLAGGISRGLARRAFGDLLPPEVRARQVKGTGTLFYQHVVRRNMSFLREWLLDGLLVREGYLDRRRLADVFAADEPFMKIYASSMLSYLAAEIWLQQWTRARQNVAIPRPAAV